MVAWIYKSSDSLSNYSELGDLITLSVDIIASLVIGLLEALSDESQESSVSQTPEKRVRLEGFRMDGHDNGDS